MLATTNTTLRSDIAHSVVPRPANIRTRSTVDFFLDFSNIAISGGHLASCHDGIFADRKLRLHAGNLRLFVQRDRVWRSGFAAAGLTNQQSSIKNAFENEGIQFDICERGQITGTEQNVDERIRLEMLEVLDHNEPGTIVLATGDGSGFGNNRGFIKGLSILRKFGFAIEVMSLQHSLNSYLRDWAKEHGTVIVLDDFYKELTYVPGQRSVSPGHVLGRKLARCDFI